MYFVNVENWLSSLLLRAGAFKNWAEKYTQFQDPFLKPKSTAFPRTSLIRQKDWWNHAFFVDVGIRCTMNTTGGIPGKKHARTHACKAPMCPHAKQHYSPLFLPTDIKLNSKKCFPKRKKTSDYKMAETLLTY